MSDITLWSFAAVALVVLATACTQAVVGFGFALLTVPIMMQIVGLQQAVILASLIGTANNIFQYRDLKHDQDKMVYGSHKRISFDINVYKWSSVGFCIAGKKN